LNQLFQLSLPDDPSSLTDFVEPVQITDYPLDIDNLLLHRGGKRLAFSCQVFANLNIQQTADRVASEKASGSLVYKFDKLFVRHWDEYMLGRRHHPFVVALQQDADGIFRFKNDPIDVLLGVDSDSPTRPFGAGKPQWSFSRSGDQFAFTRQHDETSAVAWSTNLDIYLSKFSDEKLQETSCITCANKAGDADPNFSPIEENLLVYRAQSVQGYESDQFKLMLYNSESLLSSNTPSD
jgi:dipeptidyl aminopeptidase/acylaminoacyl peptidase